MVGSRILSALSFWCIVALSTLSAGTILRLPSTLLTSLPASSETAVSDIAQLLPFQTQNATDVILEEWPSVPFTRKISEDIYLTVDKIGPPVNPDANKDIFNSLNVIYYTIVVGGEPGDKIDLPFYRTNRRVSITFGGGLESTLLRWQIASVLSALSLMMIDQGPREIIWAKVVIDKVPIVDFSLRFRW